MSSMKILTFLSINNFSCAPPNSNSLVFLLIISISLPPKFRTIPLISYSPSNRQIINLLFFLICCPLLFHFLSSFINFFLTLECTNPTKIIPMIIFLINRIKLFSRKKICSSKFRFLTK